MGILEQKKIVLLNYPLGLSLLKYRKCVGILEQIMLKRLSLDKGKKKKNCKREFIDGRKKGSWNISNT